MVVVVVVVVMVAALGRIYFRIYWNVGGEGQARCESVPDC